MINIDISGKTMVFIEESCLYNKSFFNHYVKLNETPNFDLFLEEDIELNLLDYKKSSTLKGYIFEGYLDIMKRYPNLNYIDTASYFDYKALLKVLINNQYDKLYFFTNKETVFTALKELIEGFPNTTTIKVINGKLEQWETKIHQSLDAFYIDKHLYIHNYEPIDIEYVYSPKYGHLKLFKDDVFIGGEGSIYKTYENKMVKIFHPEHITYVYYKKLQLMNAMDVFNPYINWPKDIVYAQGNFIGYVLDEIKDSVSLELLRFDNFQGYSELNRYEMSHHLLKNIYYLHQKNIVIGDLKLDNILIKNFNKAYLIDTGSYQVGDYPCTVYHPEYTKKQYSEEELRKFLRRPEDEYYAINKIIFEILVGKKPNFDREDTEIDSENDIFLYPLNINDIDENSPPDLIRWALMSSKMREMFYYYFKDGKVSYLEEWIKELELMIEKIKNIGGN